MASIQDIPNFAASRKKFEELVISVNGHVHNIKQLVSNFSLLDLGDQNVGQQHPSSSTNDTLPSPVSIERIFSDDAEEIRHPSPIEKIFTCAICLESSVDHEMDWFECAGCQSACCTVCLAEYLQQLTGESKALCCPLPDCESVIPGHVATLLVGEERMANHQKHIEMKEDADLRECPECGVLNKGSPDTPDMTCRDCGKAFCFFHDLQHAGRKCKKRHHGGGSVLSRLYISMKTTKCPGCQAPVQRRSGCPHMTCAKCRTHFCYYCGQRTISHGQHQRLWSFRCHAPRRWAMRTGVAAAAPVAAGLAIAAGGVAVAASPVALPLYVMHRKRKQKRLRSLR